MKNSERREYLEKLQSLMKEVNNITILLHENPPERYGWQDLDRPLDDMQRAILGFKMRIIPADEPWASRYVDSALNLLEVFEARRIEFNNTKFDN